MIPADKVTSRLDRGVREFTQVLDAARPAEVNAALTAVAGAVDERPAHRRPDLADRCLLCGPRCERFELPTFASPDDVAATSEIVGPFYRN